MLKAAPARWIALATLTIGLSACTAPPAPTPAPTASSVAAPCRTPLAEPTEGLLQVGQVWPQTSSDMHGYTAASLDPAACAVDDSLARPSFVNCSGAFPWISGSAEQTDAVFGTTGVEYVYSATLRGHHPVPDGQVINPLEVRELVLRLRGSEKAEAHPVVQAATKCGKAISGLPFIAYRAEIKSFDLGVDIAGILAVTSDKIIWLEFDQEGWTQAEYLRVLKLAVSDAAAL